MVFKDYYKLLSLETKRVSSEELKNAYRVAVKKNHPDVNGNDRLAEEKIKDINEAYKVLSNQTTKRRYDRIWTNNVKRTKNSNDTIVDNFFHMFFGNVNAGNKIKSKEKTIKGKNIETSIEIKLDEAFNGVNKKISLKDLDGKDKVLDVKIPQGISDGEKIRLVGQGKQGKNGGKNGDLLINVKIVKNENIKLNNSNIYTNVNITPWEAILGTKLKVKILGEDVEVDILPGTQDLQEYCIKNKGFKKQNGQRGDLFVKAKIIIPQEISEKEDKLIKEINKISNFNPRTALKN